MTTSTLSLREAFRQAVAQVATKATEKLPECAGRVESAVKLVLNGDVELLPDGSAKVFSQSNGVSSYHIANGHCDCRDYEKAPQQLCKHRLAYGIARRTREMVPQGDPEPATTSQPMAGLDPQHIVVISGKPFVRFAGLLQRKYSSNPSQEVSSGTPRHHCVGSDRARSSSHA